MLRLRDADARIFYFKQDANGIPGGRHHLYIEGNGAELGKFDGISQQVHEYLCQSHGVADHQHGQIGVGFEFQYQVFFFCGSAQHGCDRVQKARQIEFDLLDPQHARPDLFKIQDVVNNRQQVGARYLDALYVFFQVFCQAGAAQQIRKSDDGIERRTDFVAHVGHEELFQAARIFGFLPCRYEIVFQFFAFREVVNHGDTSLEIAGFIQKNLGCDERRDMSPVLAEHRIFHVIYLSLFFKLLHQFLEPVVIGIVCIQIGHVFFADNFFPGVTEPVEFGLVHFDNYSVFVQGMIPDGQDVDQVMGQGKVLFLLLV